MISPSGIRTAIRLVRPKRSGLWSIRTITCLPAFTVLHYRILVLTISFQGTLHSSLPKESSLFTLISNTLWWPKLAGENRGNRCLRLIMPADTSMALMLATTWTYSANILMRTTSICVQACGRWRYTVCAFRLRVVGWWKWLICSGGLHASWHAIVGSFSWALICFVWHVAAIWCQMYIK